MNEIINIGDRTYYKSSYATIVGKINNTAILYDEHENYSFKSINDILAYSELDSDLIFKAFLYSIGGCHKITYANPKIWKDKKYDIANATDLKKCFTSSAVESPLSNLNALQKRRHLYLKMAKKVTEKDRCDNFCAKAEAVQKEIESILDII